MRGTVLPLWTYPQSRPAFLWRPEAAERPRLPLNTLRSPSNRLLPLILNSRKLRRYMIAKGCRISVCGRLPLYGSQPRRVLILIPLLESRAAEVLIRPLRNGFLQPDHARRGSQLRCCRLIARHDLSRRGFERAAKVIAPRFVELHRCGILLRCSGTDRTRWRCHGLLATEAQTPKRTSRTTIRSGCTFLPERSHPTAQHVASKIGERRILRRDCLGCCLPQSSASHDRSDGWSDRKCLDRTTYLPRKAR
jgi:hypothetical protein